MTIDEHHQVRLQASLLDAVGHPMIAVDTDRVIIYWNKAAETSFGWTADEAIGRRSDELISRDETPARLDEIRTSLARGDSWSGDYEVVTRAGEPISVHVTNSPVFEDGRPVAVIATVADASERQRLSAIVDGSGAAIIGTSIDGTVTSWNAAAERLFGYTPAEIIGRPSSVLATEHLPEPNAVRDRLRAGGPAEHYEATRRRKDGSLVDVVLTHSPTTDEAGTVVGASVIVHDVTEQRQAQRSIEESRRLLADAQRIAHLGSIEVDLVERTATRSEEFDRIVGISPGEDPIEGLLSIVHPDDRPVLAEAWAAATHHGDAIDIGVRIVRDPLDPRSLRIHGVAQRDERGTIVKITGTVLDETERVELEEIATLHRQELLRARHAAELEAMGRAEADRANQAKSDFLSRMSHELRTPLNAILGFSQILAMGDLSVDQRKSVGFISSAGTHLLDLINDVLDISRIEAGALTLSLEPVHLTEVVDQAVSLVRPHAEQRAISLSAHIDAGVYVLADRQRLLQVLLNLLSNAVKYNRPAGRIELRADTSGGTVATTVTDTGLGIGTTDLASLFTPFQRLGAEATDIEGTGIGLALSRALSQQMGGALTVSSTLGTGSSFTLELPQDHEPRPAEPTALAAPGRGHVPPSATAVTVLAIEDNVANLEMLERAMQNCDHVTLLTAIQGRRGMEIAAEHRPDLILLDLHLPDMPGETVLRLLRADAGTATIPVVICTADATSGQRKRCLAQGATTYLTKPIDLADIFEQVERARPAATL